MSWRVFKAVNHFKRELLQKRKKCNLLYFIPTKLSLNEVSLKAKSGWNFTQNSLTHTLHVPTLLNGNVQRSWKVLPTLWDDARPIFPWPGICNVPNILNGLICFPSNSSFFFHFFHLHFFFWTQHENVGHMTLYQVRNILSQLCFALDDSQLLGALLISMQKDPH